MQNNNNTSITDVLSGNASLKVEVGISRTSIFILCGSILITALTIIGIKKMIN